MSCPVLLTFNLSIEFNFFLTASKISLRFADNDVAETSLTVTLTVLHTDSMLEKFYSSVWGSRTPKTIWLRLCYKVTHNNVCSIYAI